MHLTTHIKPSSSEISELAPMILTVWPRVAKPHGWPIVKANHAIMVRTTTFVNYTAKRKQARSTRSLALLHEPGLAALVAATQNQRRNPCLELPLPTSQVPPNAKVAPGVLAPGSCPSPCAHHSNCWSSWSTVGLTICRPMFPIHDSLSLAELAMR